MNNPFRNRTLEQITSGFNEIVQDLASLRVRNGDVIEKNFQAIERLQQRNLELGDENLKAARFQENLEKLMGS